MDNSEAVEKLAGIIAEFDKSEFISYETNAKAILAAIQADPLAYVKPKPLGWDGGGSHWYSGPYELCRQISTGVWFVWLHQGSDDGPTNNLAQCETLKAAQAAAYDDLYKRVGGLF